MSINVELALHGVDFNKVSMTLVDGLSIDKLKIRYNWIFNAVIDNAILGENSDGLVWYSGTWINGEWYGSTWYSGDFEAGVWKNGNFYSYKLNNYDIVNSVFNVVDRNDSYSKIHKGVIWENGNFYGGTFGHYKTELEKIVWSDYDGYNPNSPLESNDFTNNLMKSAIWKNGVFYNGLFTNSIWCDGIFNNGYMYNSQWINGKFYNGEFNGETWFGGAFLGGDFIKGEWYNGTFTMFDSNIKSRFGATTIRTPKIASSVTISVESDYYYPTIVHTSSVMDTEKKWLDTDTGILTKLKYPLTASIFSEYQTLALEANVNTKMLVIKGFNFNIPENATISGFEVDVSLYKDGGTAPDDRVGINYIALSDRVDLAGYVNYGNPQLGAPALTGNYQWNFSYGSPIDTWGNNWSPTLVNDTDTFSLNLQMNMFKSGTDIRALLSGVRIKVYYQFDKYIYDYTNCVWKNGIFNNGEFHSGLFTDANGNTAVSDNQNYTIWENGTFNNGKFYGGKFRQGVFNNGHFYGGFFGEDSTTPIWNDGVFENGFWVNGIFNGGVFKNGLVKHITVNGGQLGV